MPRAKRAPKNTEPPKPPTCARCGRDLDWRDRFYVPSNSPDGASNDHCKRCHQRGYRRQRRGIVKFTPATMMNRTAARTLGHTGDFAAERIAKWGEREARRLMAKRRGREQAQLSRPKRWRRAAVA